MTTTITVTDPTAAECANLAAYFAAVGAATLPIRSTSAPVTSAAPVVVNYWPTDPALAPQSPDGSQMLVETDAAGKQFIGGVPYLKDRFSRVWTMDLDGASAVSATGAIATLNGTEKVNTNNNYTSALMVNGDVEWTATGGQNQTFDASEGSFPNTALFVENTGSVAASAALALPKPSAVAPGSSGKTISVGPTLALATITAGIAQLGPGDTLAIAPGTYKEAPPEISQPVVVNAAGATLDLTGLTASLAGGGLGGFVPNADMVVNGLSVTGVALDQGSSGNTAGIRPNGGCGYLTLNGVHVFGCQAGLAQGGFPCVLVDNVGTYEDCGLPDGLSHNIYVGPTSGSLTLNGTVSRAPRYAHAVKARVDQFSWTNGEGDAANASILDLPDGTAGVAVVSGVVLNKGTADANHLVVSYGEESTTRGTVGLVLVGGTINAACPSPLVQVATGCTVTGSGVTVVGTISAIGGGSVVGL